MLRRTFVQQASLGLGTVFLSHAGFPAKELFDSPGKIITVNGDLDPAKMGFTLSHEHILVDFSGAKNYDPNAWDRDEVADAVIPYLREIRQFGCDTFVDCTPEFLGRDPVMLKNISIKTGLNIITNTGLYGASDNKYLPDYAFHEEASELAERWINEFRFGIGPTGIKPGFIKIGVNNQQLSLIHQKLVTAAALTHLKTGLTIASHTGGSVPAFEEIQVLEENGVAPSAFIWVHSQMEEDQDKRIKAAKAGAWISLDNVTGENFKDYVNWLVNFKAHGLLKKVLISHDAGWYSPGQKNGGVIRGFTDVFKFLIPAIKSEGFTEDELNQLFVRNPAEVLRIKIKKI
jgi:phosphotriesterase-related protein